MRRMSGLPDDAFSLEALRNAGSAESLLPGELEEIHEALLIDAEYDAALAEIDAALAESADFLTGEGPLGSSGLPR